MVLEPDIGRFTNEEAEPSGWTRGKMSATTLDPEGGGLRDPTSVGEENKTIFIRVWKPLFRRGVLKTLRENPEGKAQRRQYLLAVGLSRYNTPTPTDHRD